MATRACSVMLEAVARKGADVVKLCLVVELEAELFWASAARPRDNVGAERRGRRARRKKDSLKVFMRDGHASFGYQGGEIQIIYRGARWGELIKRLCEACAS